ncbi:MAG: RAD55 family ATPase, partial [Candidatus Nanohaloarchaea archaeon]
DLVKEFRKLDATVVMTAEKGNENDGYLTREGVAEYVSDGVVDIDVTSMGSGLERTINLRKMRTTDMDGSIRDLVFTDEGLKVE